MIVLCGPEGRDGVEMVGCWWRGQPGPIEVVQGYDKLLGLVGPPKHHAYRNRPSSEDAGDRGALEPRVVLHLSSGDRMRMMSAATR